VVLVGLEDLVLFAPDRRSLGCQSHQPVDALPDAGLVNAGKAALMTAGQASTGAAP
jgi:hypothetical protein